MARRRLGTKAEGGSFAAGLQGAARSIESGVWEVWQQKRRGPQKRGRYTKALRAGVDSGVWGVWQGKGR